MDYEQMVMLIKPELFILVPVLNIIGMYIKKTGIIKSWAIPITLGVLGIVVSILVLGFERGFAPSVILDGILQGILAAGIAVYAHQLKIQTTEGRLGK
ncbi:MAG: phage holin family protein [Natronincolaceae bacterium]|jgi:hypothetical protein|nr:phage holin family protein [Bacillota bacterium]NLK90892.1 holin [Clostridiales bacterium]